MFVCVFLSDSLSIRNILIVFCITRFICTDIFFELVQGKKKISYVVKRYLGREKGRQRIKQDEICIEYKQRPQMKDYLLMVCGSGM